MMVAGIDPGTRTMDLIVMDDEKNRIVYGEAIDRDMITRDPSIPIKRLRDLRREYNIQSITAPSGYGIPLKSVQEASIEEILEATFIHREDCIRRLKIVGLRRLMMLFRNSNLPAWFSPGVIHLPTVPRYRKINRIDLGTADKIYTVAAAMVNARQRYKLRPGDISMLVVESGQAYNAAILVENGEIVDGIGGTMAWWGLMGGGFIDSETCYALSYTVPGFSKILLFQGGVSTFSGYISYDEIEKDLERNEIRAVEALKVITESITKTIAPLIAVSSTKPILYLSGRLYRHPRIQQSVYTSIKNNDSLRTKIRDIVFLESTDTKIKAAAMGAAYIASGVAGGKYSWIIDTLKLDKSQGSIFDYIEPKEYALKIKDTFTRASEDC
ncbi:MAG: DUF1464 family protein [Desulfurococcales archaeon]|nr:DUF1464 family protein [Desulfurococcales archaeon]